MNAPTSAAVRPFAREGAHALSRPAESQLQAVTAEIRAACGTAHHVRCDLTDPASPGRAADPEEVARAAAWPLGDRASRVAGTVLRVDGGMRA